MISNRVLALFAVAGGLLAACEQVEQQLPFGTTDAPVTRTVPAAGTVLSTASGASFRIPASALPAGATVTLTPVPAAATLASGTPAAPYAFVLSGSAEPLEPLPAEFRLSRGDAWLASMVITTPEGVYEQGDAAVDLASGVLRARVPHLGTITPVLPAPDAVVEVGSGLTNPAANDSRSSHGMASAAAAPFATRALRGVCGGPARRCAGMEVKVGQSLFDYADLAAIVFPRVGGEITVAGVEASGSIVLDAPLRLRLRSGAVAVTIPVRITLSATPSTRVADAGDRITLSAVLLRVESSQGVEEELITLAVKHQGTHAWLSLQPSIGANFAGTSETATFSVRFPLERVF